VNRRKFATLLGGAAITLPLAARAQQKPTPVIGYLSAASPGPSASLVAAFRQGLSETGYVEGQNVAIEYRWAKGNFDRLPELAADLARHKVDLIATAGGPPPALAAKAATSTIPIVFSGVGDPVGVGLIAGLARPGGNITGFSLMNIELMPKRLALLSELLPRAKAIALIVNPDNPNAERMIGEVREAGRAKGVEVPILKASTESEIDAAFATLTQLHVAGLVVGADPFLDSRRDQLVALASRHAIAAIYLFREFVEAGGLISYGASFAAASRQLGIYAARILKGEKPADLPVQQPTTFELVINLKTAKTLGLTVPPSLLARADEVIE
jgi:putative tryptophan/tyrosine transport system substrate-binding protein